MRNLILLLIKYRNLILFILAEVLCFSLVIRYNKEQSNIYISSANRITGTIYNQYNNWARYLNLGEVADSLATENARLYAKLQNALMSQSVKVDTFEENSFQQFTYISSEVVNNSVHQADNHLTINKGQKHGILPGMGVFNDDGIIGIVRNSSSQFAHIISILHRQSRISASIKRNGYFGSLSWKNFDSAKMQLNDIPKHAEVKIGDIIQTSGYSMIFPKGIIIGKVESFFIEKGSNFYTIDVKLNNDISQAKYVYVINNLLKEEQMKLEQSK